MLTKMAVTTAQRRRVLKARRRKMAVLLGAGVLTVVSTVRVGCKTVGGGVANFSRFFLGGLWIWGGWGRVFIS